MVLIAETIWIRNFVGGDEARAERREGIEKFAATPLAAAAFYLPIAGADIVGAGVAKDIFQSVGAADILAFFADDNGEFTFVIDLVTFHEGWNLNRVIWILKRCSDLWRRAPDTPEFSRRFLRHVCGSSGQCLKWRWEQAERAVLRHSPASLVISGLSKISPRSLKTFPAASSAPNSIWFDGVW